MKMVYSDLEHCNKVKRGVDSFDYILLYLSNQREDKMINE